MTNATRLMTEAEKRRAEEAQKITALFRELKKEFPESKAHRLISTISKENKISKSKVRNILLSSGAYQMQRV